MRASLEEMATDLHPVRVQPRRCRLRSSLDRFTGYLGYFDLVETTSVSEWVTHAILFPRLGRAAGGDTLYADNLSGQDLSVDYSDVHKKGSRSFFHFLKQDNFNEGNLRMSNNNNNNEKLVLCHKMQMQTQHHAPLSNRGTKNETNVFRTVLK